MKRLFLSVLLTFGLLGCGEEASDPVVLYTSVDSRYSEPVLEAFTRDTGIAVRLVTDTEATKSVGLAERLRAERDRPVADVWWGNEPFRTIRLADEGLFVPYVPAGVAGVAGVAALLPTYADPDARWHGNGVRARVVAVDEDGPAELTMEDLADERFRDRVVIARPTAGTTGSHVAAIYATVGTEAADDLFRRLHANGARLVAGNSHAAEAVAVGDADLGLTDNDDVFAANDNLDAGLRAIVLDQGEGGLGTLTIPTTVALVRQPGTVDPRAQQLVDYLASAAVEQQLIDSGFLLGSTRSGGESAIRPMDVRYAEVAEALPEAIRRATALLEGRDPG
jgi:iron(III) transport system substrate-binding protein